MIYIRIIEYLDLLFFSEHQRLFIVNPTRGPSIIANQTRIYEKALNKFILRT